MSGVRPRLSHAGPNTYEVSEAVKGGNVVEYDPANPKKIRKSRAGSTTVVGVAETDARPYANPVSTDSDGFDTINIAPLPSIVAVGFARYPVVFAADCGQGKAIKAAADGKVTPWVSGTDAADLKIGYCDEPGGVVVATKATGIANISR